MKKTLSLITALLAATASIATAQNALHARAIPYQGTWGVRILHATAYDKANYDQTGVNAENFDVDAFMAQIDQLDTINHVMINLSRGHQASWFSAPYPALEAVMGDEFFPDRDLFGELLDAIQSRGLKTLVYYSRPGFDQSYMGDPGGATSGKPYDNIQNNISYAGAWANWVQYRKDLGNLSNDEASATIVEYYSLQYGDRIDGWWIDRCGNISAANSLGFANAARAGNPNAIVTMHGSLFGVVHQHTPECDYAAGHPRQMNAQVPWTPSGNLSGLDMVQTIEAGPFVDAVGNPDSSEGSALGHIFMPFQGKWRDPGNGDPVDPVNPGNLYFPTALALEWTTRVMDAGGSYTWAVQRIGNVFAPTQMSQLVSINASIKALYPTAGVGEVAHWQMNEGNGSTINDNVGSYDATVSNATWGSGVAGSGLDFNGTSSYVTIPANTFDTVAGSDEVTISAWVKGSNGALLRASDANGRVLNILFNSNGNLYWDAGNNGTSSFDRIFQPYTSSNDWVHWAFTKNASAGTMNIYRDGVLWHSGTGKTRTINSISEAFFGSVSTTATGSYFDGSLDEVKIFDEELSAQEIAALAVVPSAFVMSHWDFNEGSGTVASDITAGFDALVSNATWVTGGASGSALDFDGSTSSVDLPVVAFNGIEDSDEVSFAAWVDGSNGAVFRASDTNGRVLNAFFNANGKLYWDAGNDGTSSYDRIFKTVSPSEHTGGWSHWVFTKNAASGDMNIYRNGVLWHSGTGKTRGINTITSGYVGAISNTGVSGFDGLLDEVMLYNYELTASEVADLYNSQGDLGVLFTATTYDEESDPSNNSIIVVAGPKVGKIQNNSWIRFDDFNFGAGASSIVINAGAVGSGGMIQVRSGSATGTLLGSVTVTDTGGDWNTFLPFFTSLSGASGVDDLYFVFVGGSGYLLTVESFQVD